METPIGEFLVRWTVRLSMLAVLTVVSRWVIRRATDGAARSDDTVWTRPIRRFACDDLRNRRLWTAGFVLYAFHVLAAFHFIHRWSHQRAWKATALETEAAIGWLWGGGLYWNYLFTVLWLLDVAGCWWSTATRRTWNQTLNVVATTANSADAVGGCETTGLLESVRNRRSKAEMITAKGLEIWQRVRPGMLCFFGFMMIQGTLVFGPPFWKAIFAIWGAGLGIVVFKIRFERRPRK